MARRTTSPRVRPAPAPPPDAVAPAGQSEPETGTPLLLAEMSAPDFATQRDEIDLVLIPVGAHEQHGPALPMFTDSLSAQVLCALAGAFLRPVAAIAPVIPWGVSWHHAGLPGTISLRDDTLVAIVEDIVTSLHRQGIERFLIVNTHGGNNAALQVAVERCHRDHGVPIVASIYAYSLIAAAAVDVLGPEAPGHGGGDESAVVLATRPDLVDRSRLGPRDVNDPLRRVQAIVRAAGGVLPLAQDQTSVSGASGDSTGASAEAGTMILGRAASQLRAIAEEMIGVDIAPFRRD